MAHIKLYKGDVHVQVMFLLETREDSRAVLSFLRSLHRDFKVCESLPTVTRAGASGQELSDSHSGAYGRAGGVLG